MRKARRQLAPRPESAAEARRFVASLLGESPPETFVDTALLLTSELVTNAIVHARTALDLVVVVEPARVHVEVFDDDGREPELRRSTDDEVSGRGLMLVDMLATAWGVRSRDGGKCVWFEVAA